VQRHLLFFLRMFKVTGSLKDTQIHNHNTWDEELWCFLTCHFHRFNKYTYHLLITVFFSCLITCTRYGNMIITNNNPSYNLIKNREVKARN
jgi:hypothetical protein